MAQKTLYEKWLTHPVSAFALTDLFGVTQDPSSDRIGRVGTGQQVVDLLAGFGPLSGGRLTLTTNSPVPGGDVSAASTLYWTPFYSGMLWTPTKTFASTGQVSLALSGLTSGKNYDIFGWNNGGSPSLALGGAWDSDTTRGSGKTLSRSLDGWALLNADAITSGPDALEGTFLGTLRTTGSTTTEDSASKRLLWNLYNRMPRRLFVSDTTDTWTYGSSSWDYVRAQSANRVEVVTGFQSVVSLVAQLTAQQSNTSPAGFCGIGYDSSSAVATGSLTGYARGTDSGGDTITMTARLDAHLTDPGWHFYSWLQRCSTGSNVTFLGDNGETEALSGLSGAVLM